MVVMKELILTVSTLGKGVVVMKGSDFEQFLLWGRVWWS